MAILNGDCGGVLNSGTTFSPLAEYNSTSGQYEEKPAHVRAILMSLLTVHGQLSPEEIIIEDVGAGISNLVSWMGSTPMYIEKTHKNNSASYEYTLLLKPT
jgi:hypothetical protein